MLRATYHLLTREPMTERDANSERMGECTNRWQDDGEIGCDFCIEVTEQSKAKDVAGDIAPGEQAVFYSRLNHGGSGFAFKHALRDGAKISRSAGIHKPPQVIMLPLAEEIREVVSLNSPTKAEEAFLKAGFGPSYTFQQHEGLSVGNRNIRVSRAHESLSDRLQQILPPDLRLRVRLHEVGGKANELSLALVDSLDNHVGISSRGAGVIKILKLLGPLFNVSRPSRHTLILFDEPETSLHADAQHALRQFLEELAESPLIQVIYATHSPAMINTMRPASIRVLERQRIDGKPTTIIHNQAFGENYRRVRSSLGISPADSLLYAPVTIVVEGATEVRCLPVVLEKLRIGGVTGFQDIDDLLSQCHFLDGTGDCCEYLCRLAKSQNARVVVFLDGDKARLAESLRASHPDVPVVILDPSLEFEDLVPKRVYISAVAKMIGQESGGMTYEDYEQWIDNKKAKPSWLFSKRVERWLDDVFDQGLCKPVVMEQAIQDADAGEIKADPLRQLMAGIRQHLGTRAPGGHSND